jgi:hypothetical protein
MKKIIMTAAMAFTVVSLFAQASGSNSGGMTNKKGEMYLPEAGDWAVAFDASPLFNYVGNMFNSSTANNINNSFASFVGQNNTLVGKYFVDANTAYRGIVRIGFGSNSWTHLTAQDVNAVSGTAPNPTISGPTVNDKLSVSNHFIGLGAGMEKRKGKTRLQGYYGAELMFWLASAPGGDSTMTYGNSWNVTNYPLVHYYNFATKTANTPFGNPGDMRTISDDPGSIFGISLLGFVGVEYFIFPKISVGAEYTWGLNFWSQGQGSMQIETVYVPSGSPTPPNADGTYTVKTGGSSHFGVDTGVNSIFGNSNAGTASINMIFHF